jgi:radical SAM superfamily enzyme YgiQ (UPF0313 family)
MKRLLFCYVNSPRFDRTEHYVQCEYAAAYAYLVEHLADTEVVLLEYGLLGGPDRALIRALHPRPDVVIFWSAVHEAPSTRRAAAMVRAIAPSAKIVVWGDGPLWMPRYFARDPFDAAVVSGDPEGVLADLVVSYRDNRAPEHGVIFRHETGWRLAATGKLVSPERWPFPDPTLIAPAVYDAARQYRGKPGRDLSVTVARGCAVRCSGCVDPLKSGIRDRRLPIERLLAFLRSHSAAGVTFQLHGPTFGMDQEWCMQLARELTTQRLFIPFKFVTLTKHVTDEPFVAALAAAGMSGCGVGVETLSTDGRRLERKTRERDVVEAAKVAKQCGVNLTAYVQVGLPGQSREDVIYTLERLRDLGYRLRPTGHTPFQRLAAMTVAQLDELDLYTWDRKSYWEPSCGLSHGELLTLVADPDNFSPEAPSIQGMCA